jgi:hypothetical protein
MGDAIMSNATLVKHRLLWILLTAVNALVLTPAAGAVDFLFSWDASSDPGVRAYGIYQRNVDSAYQRIGVVRVQDLDDPANPSYQVTGLAGGDTFWFATTTITTSGSESGFSNQTCITVNGEVVECTDDNHDDGSFVYISCFIGAVERSSPKRTAGR